MLSALTILVRQKVLCPLNLLIRHAGMIVLW